MDVHSCRQPKEERNDDDDNDDDDGPFENVSLLNRVYTIASVFDRS